MALTPRPTGQVCSRRPPRDRGAAGLAPTTPPRARADFKTARDLSYTHAPHSHTANVTTVQVCSSLRCEDFLTKPAWFFSRSRTEACFDSLLTSRARAHSTPGLLKQRPSLVSLARGCGAQSCNSLSLSRARPLEERGLSRRGGGAADACANARARTRARPRFGKTAERATKQQQQQQRTWPPPPLPSSA